ncbi:MAG: hypothetical protein JOZ21_08550 [Verrucomicrobia bacterium]|nr:hypothetical protein [Verrucomicrobiota bacterium]
MADDKQKSRTSIPMIVTGLVMTLLFVGLAGFLVLQRASIPTVDEQTAQVRLKNLADLNAENQRILTQYHWVDKTKGVVGIPINRAMDLVLAELQANKPHAAGPVNPPAAPPPATPAPSPNNQRPGGGQ